MQFEYIIVGAGFAGAVLAERIASQIGKKVLVLEKRDHIGGNCYDAVDHCGVLVHRYGPHLFHTDSQKVWAYLSRFTQWHPYEHKVLACVDGKKVPIPFSFYTLDALFAPKKATFYKERLLAAYGENQKVPVLELLQHADSALQKLGRFVYEKFFVNYTAKQWGKKPEDIDPSVTARVPVITGYEDRYFTDRFQAVPKEGYTKLFEKLLAHPNISLELGVDALERLRFDGKQIIFDGRPFEGTLIYTGEIDALFGYRYGALAYRSLDLRFETVKQPFFQENSVVNYPNDHDFTRITEFKYIHPVDSSCTTILREYPQAYERGKNLPFYPIFTDENRARYERYAALAKEIPSLMTVGRLAEYRYYDMDDIVLRALEIFEKEIAS